MRMHQSSKLKSGLINPSSGSGSLWIPRLTPFKIGCSSGTLLTVQNFLPFLYLEHHVTNGRRIYGPRLAKLSGIQICNFSLSAQAYHIQTDYDHSASIHLYLVYPDTIVNLKLDT